jgi:hypothetical protein
MLDRAPARVLIKLSGNNGEILFRISEMTGLNGMPVSKSEGLGV